jgi:hypothetical protein
MKTILTILICAVVITTPAQDMNDEFRTVSARRISLKPVFSWWTNATAIIATNKSLPIKKKIPLPERPLKHWVRVTTDGAITNNGFAWFARVSVQEKPDDTEKFQWVVLRHGPFEEKKKLDSAVAAFDDATSAREYQTRSANNHRERADYLATKRDVYQNFANHVPGYGFGADAAHYRKQARIAQNNADAAQSRADFQAARQGQLFKITQGRSILKVDTFAMPTGEKYKGLLVYEFGLPFGR